MKKILSTLALTFAIAAVAFMALMPGAPSTGECSKFHPHTDDFGGPAETLKVLGYLATNMPINVWTDGVRTVVQATYQTKQIFVVYGTGNPTMFTSSRGIDYIREQTAGLNKVNSESGIQNARDSINNCLKNSYESNLVPASSSASIPTPSLSPSLVWGIGGSLFIIAMFLVGKKLLFN